MRPLKLEKVLGNLSETSCALRRFWKEFRFGFLYWALMKKAHVIFFLISSRKRKAGHVPLALQVGSLEYALRPVSVGTL